MRIGIDFDNTIVAYDRVIHRVALAQGLIPAHLPANKSAVRDYLRTAGREPDWTALQSEIYGPGLIHAEPFPGVAERVAGWLAQQVPVYIISHKTRYPYAGERHDLHAAAWNWLERQGFFDHVGLPREHVFFELTLPEKLQRIGQARCTHFIDDLPELLAEPTFPAGVRRLLFDPNDAFPGESRFARVRSWAETVP
jgi:hypothetical protein